MPWPEYRARFDRANICDLSDTNDVLSNRVVVVLGRNAWSKFYPVSKLEWFARFGTLWWSTFIPIPHPSGRNHFYNDPANRERVTKLLQEIK